MASPKSRGTLKVDVAALIKQREHNYFRQLNLTLPLFNVARRPRLAASLMAIMSKPVAPT